MTCPLSEMLKETQCASEGSFVELFDQKIVNS